MQARPGIFFLTGALSLCLGLFSCQPDSDFQRSGKPQVTLSQANGRLVNDILSLNADTVYILATDLVRGSGQELRIQAGTLVRVNDRLTISILEGAKIIAQGTSSSPIILTSNSGKGAAGPGGGGVTEAHFWYGLHIYGNALNDASSSGELSYLRIEFAGGNQNGAGLPSLLFSDVTDNTVLHDIQVSYSYSASSYEFRGGDCNASQLLSYASVGTDFYINSGYSGKLQQLLAYRHPYFPSNTSIPGGPPFNCLAGVFIGGAGTYPKISNLTVLGPDLQPGTGLYYKNLISPTARVAAMVVADGAKFRVRNSVLMGFPKVAFYLDDFTSALSLNDGESELSSSVMHSNDSSTITYLTADAFPFTSQDLKTLLSGVALHNEFFQSSSQFFFADPFAYDLNPDPSPAAASPLLNGADFSGFFSDPFYSVVPYRGASGGEKWFAGWSNFIPGQTDYNN